MEQHVYQQIFDVEKTHWWFVGRRKIISSVLKRHIKNPLPRALDIGSGTGLNSVVLKEFAKQVSGLDPANEAVRLSLIRVPDLKVMQESFPYVQLGQRYNLITMFDVLEHIEDDALSLRKLEELLMPGGVAVLTVPAFPILWSDHDRVLKHFRRYTMKSLRSVITANTSLAIQRMSYFNSLFFVPIVAFRVLRKVFHILPDRADDFMVHPIINKFFLFLFSLEGKLVGRVPYPFGISIICVLKKPDSPAGLK